MSPIFITSIIGIVLSVMVLGQVAPSMIQSITAKKVEVSISREEALMQQIIRYRALEGVYPADVATLVAHDYWQAEDNSNGFGGTYSFSVDSAKGTLTISTSIADATQRTQYLNNFRHIFTPTSSGNTVTTTFVMPSTGSIGAPIPVVGSIPTSAVAPDAATNTWWFDTSGESAVLKISDGTTWSETSLGGTGGGVAVPVASNIVSGIDGLSGSASEGDIRYVYDPDTNSLTGSYVYYNGGWVLFSGNSSGVAGNCVAGTAAGSGSLSTQSCIYTATVSSGDLCTWNKGYLGYDGVSGYYACQDLAQSTNLSGVSCSETNRITYDINGNGYKCSN